MRDVFLSYSDKDRDDASDLCKELTKERGLTCFLAKKDLQPSQDFSERIRSALLSCRVLCLLATPDALESEWVATEWGAAWALHKPVIPILLRCNVKQLPDRLQRLVYVDFHKTDEIEEAIREAIALLSKEPPEFLQPQSAPYVSTEWLRDVCAGPTEISHVSDDTTLCYRGKDIADLVKRPFEAIAHLILDNKQNENLDSFSDSLRQQRQLSDEQINLIKPIAGKSMPIDVLRTCISHTSHFDKRLEADLPEAEYQKAKTLVAQVPTMIACIGRMKDWKEPITPNDDLGHVANFYYMLTGEPPTPAYEEILDAAFVLYAEHGFSASTFAARIVASARSDLHSAVVAAAGALKGWWHGGANQTTVEMLAKIDSPETVDVDLVRDPPRRYPGFGHPIYQDDPRASLLHNIGWKHQRALATKDRDWLAIADAVEKYVEEDVPGLRPNIDFPCGVLFRAMGMDHRLYPAIFLAARLPGICAHVMEQRTQKKLIRPRSCEPAVVKPRQAPSAVKA